MDNFKIVNCTHCGQKLKVPSDKNLKVTCPKCKSVFRVYAPQQKSTARKTFVDELNQMPSKEQKAQEQASAKYKEELLEILGIIREACIDNRDQKCAKGYVVRQHDAEYCYHGFKYLASLTRDNSDIRASSYTKYKSGHKFYASMLTKYSGRNSLEPMSANEADCSKFINDLRADLVNDGFQIIKLAAVPCYQEYDVLKIKAKGLFDTTASFNHIMTDDLLGYTIEFHLVW